MEKKAAHVETLSEIRNMMQRSSRFISLSGLSGISAGVFALAGAFVANYILNNRRGDQHDTVNALFFDAALVLLFSLVFGIFFTVRRSKRKGLPVWDHTSRRMLINLCIPLLTGGIFCFILLYHNIEILVAPSMLIFYGLSLLNGSKYTLEDIRYLGILEIALGLTAAFFTGYGLLFWTIGFGVLHIIYGAMMYYKYE